MPKFTFVCYDHLDAGYDYSDTDAVDDAEAWKLNDCPEDKDLVAIFAENDEWFVCR